MKIRAEVIGVETMGDKLAVTLQGNATRESQHYGRMGKHTVQVAATKANGKAYYVGRVIRFDMRPVL